MFEKETGKIGIFTNAVGYAREKYVVPVRTTTPDRRKTALIVGAGPAGLRAALELLRRTDVPRFVIETDSQVGGLPKTISYRGIVRVQPVQ